MDTDLKSFDLKADVLATKFLDPQKKGVVPEYTNIILRKKKRRETEESLPAVTKSRI